MKTDTLFNKTRRRIIAAIMAVLVALFATTLVAIYAFSYAEVYNRNIDMLENYASHYQANRLPPGFATSDTQRPPEANQDRRLAPYYAVLFSPLGTVVTVENADENGYTAEELVEFATSALATGKRSGLEGSLMFACEKTSAYTLVAFMDNTLVTESMGTLFRYTLIVGLVALVLLFFVARWLAGRITSPMQRAYEMQQRFVADASHELKTPVAIVEANAELLSREVGESQWLANIRHENARMSVLVGELLELTRTEQHDSALETVDLGHLVKAEALSCEPIAYELDMELRCEIEEPVKVRGNASQLVRLTSILVDNALSHGTSASDVELTLETTGDRAVLAVTNAICPDDVAKLRETSLFERFTRTDGARGSEDASPATAHYGLGLAIAQAIVDAHHGTIDFAIDDARPTITFKVTLPLAR